MKQVLQGMLLRMQVPWMMEANSLANFTQLYISVMNNGCGLVGRQDMIHLYSVNTFSYYLKQGQMVNLKEKKINMVLC